MELLTGIKTRNSCRAFNSDPIPHETLEEILKVAGRSPSFSNSQPWEVYVVSGKKKDEISKVLYKMASTDVTPKQDIPFLKVWPSGLDKRIKEHGAKRFAVLGIERGDEQKRRDFRLSNYKFYGAPCVIFLFIERSLSNWSLFDTGSFTQSLILAAHSFGLASCLQASVTDYPAAIREILGVPATKMLVLGIAIGYPDLEAKINTYHSARANLDEFVKWL